MIVGLLIALASCAPPTAPGLVTESHKDAVARFGAAVWNLRRERLLTAAKQLEAAAKQDPSATTPKRELIKVYAQIGREPDAIRIARELLQSNPSDVDTAHALTRLYYSVGDLKEAVAVAKQAIEIGVPIARADKAVSLYRDVATIGEKADDPTTAARALTKAVDLLVGERAEVIAARAFTPRDADAIAAECLERLGKAQAKLRLFEEAAGSFESAARLFADPKVNDPSAALRLAWNLSGVYEAQGNPTAAIRHLNVFLRLKPITTEPYERLARLLARPGAGMRLSRSWGGSWMPTARTSRSRSCSRRNWPAIRAVSARPIASSGNSWPRATTRSSWRWSSGRTRERGGRARSSRCSIRLLAS